MTLLRWGSRFGLIMSLALSFAVLLNLRSTTEAGGTAPLITTFSIVAYDPDTNEYGIAVQSKFFAVGDVVPFAQADSGALATQAVGNPLFGPRALELFKEGVSAQAVIEKLLAGDPERESRQLGAVDTKGTPATFTGSKCLPWAGGKTGEHYTVQGNLLAGPQVLDAMAATYEAAPGDLASRLIHAISAGQAAGGDARERASDTLWWLAAQTRLLDGDRMGALEAAQTALLLSPSWPRLPEATRIELGVKPELVDALREDDGFRRLWDALAIQAPVARKQPAQETAE